MMLIVLAKSRFSDIYSLTFIVICHMPLKFIVIRYPKDNRLDERVIFGTDITPSLVQSLTN